MPGTRPAPDPRLAALEGMRAEYLEGPDAMQWRVEIEPDPPAIVARALPPGALLFAGNGYGDSLFLKPGEEKVYVLWHEGGEIAEYAPSLGALRPDLPRAPSAHPEITYHGGGEPVRLGDRVAVRYWLVLKGSGEVVYVPGVSPQKPSMERDGLAWVGIRLDDGGPVDTIVMPDGALKRSVRLLAPRPTGAGSRA